MSPNGKSKTKLAKKKRGTGVAASNPEYPASTNVSSPIQAASRRRPKHATKQAPPLDLHKYDYSHADDFVAGDDEQDAVETEDDSKESFEPIRVKGKPRSIAKRSLGPPITTDEKIQRLNQIHQMVVEDFVNTAKLQSQKVSTRKVHDHFQTELRQISF